MENRQCLNVHIYNWPYVQSAKGVNLSITHCSGAAIELRSQWMFSINHDRYSVAEQLECMAQDVQIR